MTLLLCLMATSSLLDSSPIRPVSVVNEPADGAPPFTATFHKPVTVGESNYTHFWMPIPMFRVALAAAAPLFTVTRVRGATAQTPSTRKIAPRTLRAPTVRYGR